MKCTDCVYNYTQDSLPRSLDKANIYNIGTHIKAKIKINKPFLQEVITLVSNENIPKTNLCKQKTSTSLKFLNSDQNSFKSLSLKSYFPQKWTTLYSLETESTASIQRGNLWLESLVVEGPGNSIGSKLEQGSLNILYVYINITYTMGMGAIKSHILNRP